MVSTTSSSTTPLSRLRPDPPSPSVGDGGVSDCSGEVGGGVEVVFTLYPTLLHYASLNREQKKCWELLAQKFD